MDDEREDPKRPMRGCGLVHNQDGPCIGAYQRDRAIGLLIYEGMRPGVEYTVFLAEPEFRDPPEWFKPGERVEEIRVFVALSDHNDAAVGEWAIFHGWATKQADPPARVMTSPTKELRYFANPQRIGRYLVYQRVEPQGDEVFAMDDTPQDEAAAMRA
jgi:hypothetical protein